jgi:hypothetical protein
MTPYSKYSGVDAHVVEFDAENLSMSSPGSPPAVAIPATSTSTGRRRIHAIVNVALLMALAVLQWSDLEIGYDWARIDTRGNNKWIVVTTINEPSSTMQALCGLPDWEVSLILPFGLACSSNPWCRKVVVVADLKTPKDWQSGPACHYVSVDEQRRLPFSIRRLTPFRAYTRKNLGYLYAISLGAEVIFDTDDDNLPTQGINMHDVDDVESVLVAYQVCGKYYYSLTRDPYN